ncbi:MAG: molybdopterin molybdenumtransferase MoeA [Thermoprotei archaeon]|nr:MAG: molybdopterin molybdenumtransferase MoeA [Thermoprotei archaeon]
MSARGRGFAKLSRVEEVLMKLKEKVTELSHEEVPLRECYGRVLGVDVESPMDLPPFHRSAVDGYAVKAEDTFNASIANPVKLRLKGKIGIGEVEAPSLNRGEAVKVDTGSLLPPGSDAVVMLEYTKKVEDWVEVYSPVAPWQNVSKKGEDVKRGEVVLNKGMVLHPQDIALAASLGLNKLTVVKRPRVLIIPTGVELLQPGEPWTLGRVYNSNAYMLLGLAKLYGAVGELKPPIPGDYGSVEEALRNLSLYDSIVFTGGSSAGEEDVVPEVIARRGELVAHGLALKPGMPAAAAVVEGKPVFSLPGFPVACMIAFEELVGPTLAWMAGMKEPPKRATVKAILDRRVPGSLGRKTFLRVKLSWKDGVLRAEPLRASGSGVLSSVVKADGYVVIPEDQDLLEEGGEVEVKLYRGWMT